MCTFILTERFYVICTKISDYSMEKYFDMYINCVLGSESQEQSREKDIWYSIFPIENQDLLYKRWEDDIIWDAEVRLSGEITTVVSGIIMSNDFI